MTQGGQNGLIQICISKQGGNLMNIMNIEHELWFQTKFLYDIQVLLYSGHMHSRGKNAETFTFIEACTDKML